MSDARIAEMISRIAHELRSPLTSVKGFSSMLLTRWDRFTEEQRYQFVETIAADAERMGRIVSEVLDLSRMEAGRLELHREQVSIATVIDAARGHFKDHPGAERVAVAVDDELTVWADAVRLEAVVANLIENALKFSDEGPVSVEALGSKDTVSITVRDEGTGIEPDRLAGIFSGPAAPGGRATPSGAGLGLYLTRGLVELHGGSVTAESTFGKGATFTVTLPARKSADG